MFWPDQKNRGSSFGLQQMECIKFRDERFEGFKSLGQAA
jgi:hypothetical protein